MMKILFINHHRRSRSIYRAGELARRLAARGHKVSLMLISDNNKWKFKTSEWNKVKVIETPDVTSGKLRSGWDPLSVIRRILWLRKHGEDYDILHLFETRPATIYPGLYIARARNNPVAIDWIDWWGRGGLIEVNRPSWYRLLFGGLETFFEEHYRPKADLTTVISAGLKERAVSLGVKKDTILHLRPGVDTERFSSIPVQDARKKTGMPPDEFLLGFGSRDSFLDLDKVLEAVRRLVNEGYKLRLLMLGTCDKSTMDQIARKGIENEVIRPGFVPDEDYPLFLSSCDAFVMPFPDTSYNIGRWPNKFTEYLACARPIVFNPNGDLKEFRNRECGISCEDSTEEYVQAIRGLVEDEGSRRVLGQNARKMAQEEFRWVDVIDRLELSYLKMVEEWKADGRSRG